MVEGGKTARMHFGRRPKNIPSISGLASDPSCIWAVAGVVEGRGGCKAAFWAAAKKHS